MPDLLISNGSRFESHITNDAVASTAAQSDDVKGSRIESHITNDADGLEMRPVDDAGASS